MKVSRHRLSEILYRHRQSLRILAIFGREQLRLWKPSPSAQWYARTARAHAPSKLDSHTALVVRQTSRVLGRRTRSSCNDCLTKRSYSRAQRNAEVRTGRAG
ncbi:hypothetical protein AB1Y20_002464 [Prymnesium parvum]|uniref:Uncharacterized protein n=1 Tax=Prymnesium parvum TaxID=97485 RepID=A0AB34J945_PRYPA